jgi:hypothetical protein
MLNISLQYSAVFSCQQMRDLVRARGHYLMAGMLPDHPVVAGLKQQRDGYIRCVGLAAYLSQMLGEIASCPVSNCVLGWDDGRILDNFNFPISVQRFIRAHYSNDLPYVVEVNWDGRVVARFL